MKIGILPLSIFEECNKLVGRKTINSLNVSLLFKTIFEDISSCCKGTFFKCKIFAKIYLQWSALQNCRQFLPLSKNFSAHVNSLYYYKLLCTAHFHPIVLGTSAMMKVFDNENWIYFTKILTKKTIKIARFHLTHLE